MKRLHPYLATLMALMLVAMPWAQTAEVLASSDEPACSCCQGPCQGCCCSVPARSGGERSVDTEDGCRCELSESPAVPAEPMELRERRSGDRPDKAPTYAHLTGRVQDDPGLSAFASYRSPPPAASRPAYVLFGTLLI